MPSARQLALLVLAAGAAALLAAAALRSHPRIPSYSRPPPHEFNPLELWNVAGVRVELGAGGAAGRAPSIRCNASTLAGSHEWVSVSWSGLHAGRLDDYIALFPAGAAPTQTAPIKYHWAARSASHLPLGAGSVSFRLLNMRQDLRFALIRNGLQFPTVAAWSEVVRVESPNLPMQGHLSLTGVEGEMMVQWATRDAGSCPKVRWGPSPDRLHSSADGDSQTYGRGDMCGPPANGAGWMEPGWLHGAVMAGLEPSARVFYQYGDEDLGWSEVESFTAPPAVGPSSTVQVLAIADLGQAEEDGSMEASEMIPSLLTTARLAQEAGAQLLVHNGDISYARGYSSQWDRFWDQLGPVVRRMPYMTTVGNHERDWPGSGDRFPGQYDSGGECGIPYYRRTRMPTPSEDRHWFSFDFGPVHFLQYSTEHLFEPGSEQHAFIERDLASVNRSRTPWVVVGGHRPIYIDSTFYWQPDGDQFVAQQLRDSLEGLFHKYQVDVTWHGHHHSYQRTCEAFRNSCLGKAADGTANAPVHLVMGHAGMALSPNIHFFQPRIFRAVQLAHGYLRVTANATHMHTEALASLDGLLMDAFTLTKPPGWGERFRPRDLPGASASSSSLGSGSKESWGGDWWRLRLPLRRRSHGAPLADS